MFFREEFVASLSTGAFWLFILAISICLIGFLYLYIHHLKISRLIKDTPTSKIGSAAQGFAEIKGTTVNPGPDLVSPLSGKPCIWFRYRIEKEIPGSNSQYNWRTIYSGQSPDPIAIQDNSNLCFINASPANIEGCKTESWFTSSLPDSFLKDLPNVSSHLHGELRITEERIEKNTEIYGLGTFQTITSNTKEVQALRVKKLIHTWQQDHEKLLKRFDKNNNLKLDTQEWQHIKQTAKSTIGSAISDPLNDSNVHILTHSRLYPFIISTKPEKTISNRYRLISMLFLGMFVFSTLVWSDLTLSRL